MKNFIGKNKWIIIGVAIALVAVVCVALLLISPEKKDTAGETTGQTTTETTTVETTTEETTVQTDPPVLYRHPLTGAPLEEPCTDRVVSVVINNHEHALPQYGVSKADIIYEFETEGGITRLLGLFTDLENVEQVGPIRSARSYFNNISAAFGAPIIHCGGSETGIAGYYDFNNKLKDWEHLNAGASKDDPELPFFRDLERYYNQGYNWEHTLFGRGPKIVEEFKKKDISLVNEKGTDFGFVFDEAAAIQGEDAKEIVVKFLGTKKTTMTYDETAGKYMMAEYGEDLIDGINNEQLGFKNVIVVFADQTKRAPKKTVLSYYDMIGTGEGYMAMGGKITEIKWSRETVYDPFVYTYEDGTPVTFSVGNSYVAVVDPDGSVKYE